MVLSNAGEFIFVDFATSGSTGGNGPAFEANDFSLTTGIQGKWLTVSLSGGNVPPSYTQLVFLIADDTSACEPGTLDLTGVLFSDPVGNSIPFCGTLDVPCAAPPAVSKEIVVVVRFRLSQKEIHSTVAGRLSTSSCLPIPTSSCLPIPTSTFATTTIPISTSTISTTTIPISSSAISTSPIPTTCRRCSSIGRTVPMRPSWPMYR